MSDALPKSKRRVERIEDWDNARYAITPPRAALDLRLTLIHFRLMAMLGRVNTRQGWCEMSQTKFAEALGYARGSVVRAVKELVEWRYVEKRGQEEAGSARCHYRLIIDDPEPETDGTCHVGGDTPTCHVGGDTGVTPDATHVSRTWDTEEKDHRSKITPQPPGADAAGGREGNSNPAKAGKGNATPTERALRPRGPDWARILAVARSATDEAYNRALDHLIAPVVTVRRLDAPTASEAVRVIARFAAGKGLSEHVLAATAKGVLAARRSTVKPSDFEDALNRAEAQQRRTLDTEARFARLVPIDVDPELTERFMAELRRVAPANFLASWWNQPVGVAHVRDLGRSRRVSVVTPRRAGMMQMHGDSGYASAACRVAFGSDAAIEFLEGRPVPARTDLPATHGDAR